MQENATGSHGEVYAGRWHKPHGQAMVAPEKQIQKCGTSSRDTQQVTMGKQMQKCGRSSRDTRQVTMDKM